MRNAPAKTSYYLLEGTNSFATSFFFNYLLFVLRDTHGFGNQECLYLGAAHGLLFVIGAWFGGRFGQRHGYFSALRIGFGGMALAIAIGGLFPSLAGQLAALGLWTVTMCFTWPNLEALVSENEPPRSLARRVGIYNVVWAATGAVAYSAGGWLIANLGHASLYWVPVLIHATQFAATWPLRRSYDQTRESTQAAHAAASELEPHHPTVPKPKYFKALGWAANPFSYMAINTLLVLVPGLARKLGLSMAEAGLLMSVWYHARTAAFVVLWLWPGWHYRFSWFAGAFALLFGSFLAMMTTQSIAILLLAQLGFGWATALIYYSSLYYAMDGTETHGTHGGIHEALVGIGICGGPAVSATAFWLSGNPQSPTWAMAGILALGGALVFRVRGRPVRLA